MSILTFPATPVPAYQFQTGQIFKTLVSEFDSGAEVRRRLFRFAKRNYSMGYNNITLTNRNILNAFYHNVGGMADAFWFVDWASRTWTDEYVGRGGPLELIGSFLYHSNEYTNELIAVKDETEDDVTLFNDPPYVGDAYYFGALNQFDELKIILTTPGIGVWTIVWEYWDGNSWEALAGITDETASFTALSEGSYPDLFDDGDWDMNDAYQGDIVENIRLTFEKNMSFTIPVDWTIYEVNNLNAYWIRARISVLTSYTTLPVASMVRINSKTYDLHGLTCSSVSIYIDGILQTAGGIDYTFVSGGGAAGADRITFIDYPAIGSLITSDLTGYLRLKARLGDDSFQEEIPYTDIFNIGMKIEEVQW